MKGGSSCGVGKKHFLPWFEKPLESVGALGQDIEDEDEENLCQTQQCSWGFKDKFVAKPGCW